MLDWQNLYESSVNSLQSDDEVSRSVPHQPFFLNRPPSLEKPLGRHLLPVIVADEHARHLSS